jgi:hypothetical protein
MLRIRRAIALDGYTLRLTLTSGEVVERDLEAILWGPAFEPLLDLDRFRAVSVEAGTVVWPGDLDVDPDTLIWGGTAPADPGARPPRHLKVVSPGGIPARPAG